MSPATIANPQPAVSHVANTRRQALLRAAVAQLAPALACGAVRLAVDDLEALAALCAAHGLPAEAARVRRWMGV